MNIVVIGAGGVGGYFGGKLAKAGFNVTFIARGKHLEAIKNKGLQVKSILGDFTVYPEAIEDINNIKNPDLVILGVKSWQVLDIAKQLKPVINETTMVLPLQNGADNADKLLSVLPKQNVLAGLCKIVSKVESPGVINHFTFEPEIVFGEYDNTKSNRCKHLKIVFDKAGFNNTWSDDIHLDIWRKFLFIGTISGIGAITRAVFGDMRTQEGIRKIIYDTAHEMVRIANAKGVGLTSKDIDMIVKVIDSLDYNTTASMQRDMMEGKPSELENFNGYVVQQGKLLNIETPTNAFIYHCLLPQELKARS
ncbi:2-dehydropantoate 2-reductase [Sabulilitoribacter multivorans]|uniref:2-dehydropantoate 2-reductase n=1 Tax=Flaviramulus multivorans TaxID=1304750 RepID=A0ABS9IH27_9FLAO|nr:2-dehydropantoate 2-reductase [Flaviramulus multivorans]MCF7559863.1 2-dehydropantoate 2-reductase [Flaviramulus multivorans]